MEKAALLGLVLGIAFYLFVLVFKFLESTKVITAYFYDRGWVPYVLTYLTCWSFAILWFKRLMELLLGAQGHWAFKGASSAQAKARNYQAQANKTCQRPGLKLVKSIIKWMIGRFASIGLGFVCS